MKIWILSSKFGQGQWSVAEALKEKYETQGHRVIISDVVALAYPKTYHLIYRIFNDIISRNSAIYNFVNTFGRKSGKVKKASRLVRQAYAEVSPDMVITTWSAAACMLGEADVPLTVCVTDFGVHPGWVAENASGYIVADDELKEKLVDFGVSQKIICTYGIPVKNKFHSIQTKPLYSSNVLIMGGGLGICPWIDELLSQLTLHQSLSISVITGNNKKLYKRLVQNYPTIEVVGYTEQIELYMARSAVIVSKPGGVSLAESMAVKVPFIAMYPSYEHELENAAYIEKHHIGSIIRAQGDIIKVFARYVPLCELDYRKKKCEDYESAV